MASLALIYFLMLKFAIDFTDAETRHVTFTTPAVSATDAKFYLLSQYGYSAAGKSSFSFWVKTCADAYVGLLLTDKDTMEYDYKKYVVLGRDDNTNSQIVMGTSKSDLIPRQVLECDLHQKFNIHWNVTGISVFSFSRTDNVWSTFMEFYPDLSTDLVVRYIGVIALRGGEWKFAYNTDSTALAVSTETTTSPATTSLTTSPTLTSSTTSPTATSATTTSQLTTTQATTSSIPPPSTTTCSCFCTAKVSLKSATCDAGDIACMTEEMKEELTMDKSTLSTTIRKKMCAPDYRPSSRAMGWFGASILAICLSIIVIPDAVKLVNYFILNEPPNVHKKAKKRKSTRSKIRSLK